MKNLLLKIIIIFFFILIFIKKNIMYSIIYDTTIIWFKNIVPNLFPMFIISSLMVNSNIIIDICNVFGKCFNKIFKCSNYGLFVFSLSLITGSPSNAKYIKDLVNKGLINNTTTDKLLLFTANYNPLLIYSLISKYLSKYNSIMIILIIVISNIFVGLIFRSKEYSETNNLYIPEGINLSSIIKDNIDILLMILGVLLVFNIIISIIPINNPIMKNILNGFLEITTALYNLKNLKLSTNFKMILSIIYLSFGGFSIHVQIKSILTDTNYHLYFKSRIISIIISLNLLLLFHSTKLI